MIILLISVICSWILVQSLKVILSGFRWNAFFRDGGMPSGHSAVVSSLATGVYLLEGFSIFFLITATFAAIIMRDACGVRQETQKHAITLNKYLKLDKKNKLSEYVGHTLFQVIIGGLIGISVTLLIFNI